MVMARSVVSSVYQNDNQNSFVYKGSKRLSKSINCQKLGLIVQPRSTIRLYVEIM